MLRQFFSYYRPFMGLFWLDFGCAVLSGLLELAFPLAITAFIDHLLPQGNWTLTVAAAAGLLALELGAAARGTLESLADRMAKAEAEQREA